MSITLTYCKSTTYRNKIQKFLSKAQKAAILIHNKHMMSLAKEFAKDLRANPSELEKKMQLFLDAHNMQYDFQRIFYIKDFHDYIERFYIADFYIPSRNLIIETDGAFHEAQIKKDIKRTHDIKRHYSNIHVIRWKWHDFNSIKKLQELLGILKIS